MKTFLIVLISAYLISQSLQTATFSPSHRISKPRDTHSIEHALVYGDKSYLNRRLKSVLKRFSLLHLFTPSGLHFSSVYIYFKYFYFLKNIFLIFSVLFSFTLIGFLALKRVIYFYLFKSFIKNNFIAFTLTFLFSLLIGQYHESPLSYLFSFVFWGTIFCHRGPKVKLIFKMFIIQIVISLLMDSDLNILSLIINPILTSIITLVFPILLMGHLMNFFPVIRYKLYSLFEHFLNSIYIEDLNLMSSIGVLLFSCFLLSKRRKILIPFFLLISINRSSFHSLYTESRDKIYPLAPITEALSSKKNRLYFVDRKCWNRKLIWRCKIKPSRYGGLSI